MPTYNASNRRLTAVPRSLRRRNTASASSAMPVSSSAGLTITEILTQCLPATPTNDDNTAYDVPVNTTFSSIRLRSDDGKVITLSVVNGNLFLDGNIVTQGDVVAYASTSTQVQTIQDAVNAATSSGISQLNASLPSVLSQINTAKTNAINEINSFQTSFGTEENNINGQYVRLWTFTFPSNTYCQYSGQFFVNCAYLGGDMIHVDWGCRIGSSPSAALSTFWADCRGNTARTNKIAFGIEGTTISCYILIEGTDYFLGTLTLIGAIMRAQGTSTGTKYSYANVASGTATVVASLPTTNKKYSVKA